MKINKISPDKNAYINILTSIDTPPKELYYIGILPAKRQPTVAIVGTRKPTAYGKEVAITLARELAQHGIIIVSGLALGIDTIAHKACLDAGGTTIAVLGNGLHKIYPHTNRALGERIIDQGGVVLSEFEAGIEPLPFNFLKRNRIVSGLADVVVVIEAASRSGTLNTAMHALNQGREVCAVPGNITSPLSAGCNRLLRQGATPVTSSADIIELLPLPATNAPMQSTIPLGNNPLENRIISLLQEGVRDGNELQQKSGASPGEFNSALTMLEIAGTVTALGANQWRLY